MEKTTLLEDIIEFIFSKKYIKVDGENYLNVANIFSIHFNSVKNTLLIKSIDSDNYTCFSIEHFIECNPDCKSE